MQYIHEPGDGSKDVAHVLESMQVNSGPPGDVSREGKPGANGQASDDEACHDDKRNHTSGPGKADDRNETLEKDGKDDTADRSAAEDDPDSGRALASEPVTDDGDARVEHEGDADTEEYSLGQEELVCAVRLCEGDHHHREDADDRSERDEHLHTDSQRVGMLGDERQTEVPYASKMRPVSGPKPYRKKTWRDPMRAIDADDEDGRSVDS